jgi:hypothetical protein
MRTDEDNDGWRFERVVPGGARVDVTDDVADPERRTFEMMAA